MRRLFFSCLLGLSGALGAASAATPWLNYGNGLYQKGQFDAALKAYETALSAEPQNAVLYQAKGSALFQLGRKDDAIRAFQRSLELNPNNTALSTYVNSLTVPAVAASSPVNDDDIEEAKNLIAEHKLEEAAAKLQAILKASPNSASAQAALGDVYYAQGRMQDARGAYTASLKLDAEQPRVQQTLEAHLPEGIENAASQGAKGNPWSPLWRSAIFPGWGQVYNGQSNKGIVIGGFTLAFLGGAVASYLGADHAYQDYAALGPGTGEADFNASYNRLQSYATANHILAVLFYSAYLYNLGDAAANARPAVTLGLRQNAQGTLLSSLNWSY